MKPTTLNALLRVYDQLDEIVSHLNNLAQIELELEAFDEEAHSTSQSRYIVRTDVEFGSGCIRTRGLTDGRP